MKKKCMILVYNCILLLLAYFCKQSSKRWKEKRNYFKGKTTILVDDSFHLDEDQVAVFQSKYKAEITVQGNLKTN
jgi:hypothetical protein